MVRFILEQDAITPHCVFKRFKSHLCGCHERTLLNDFLLV